MPRLVRPRRTTAAATLLLALAACADGSTPPTGSSILSAPGGPNASGGADTVRTPLTSRTYAGVIVRPSTDSLAPWTPLGGLPVELVRVDEERGTTTVLATGTSDADGGFRLTDPTNTPWGLLSWRVVPPAASGYLPTQPTFAYAAVPENAQYAYVAPTPAAGWPADTPLLFHTGVVIDAPQFGTPGNGVPGAIISLQKIVRQRYDERELSPVIEYGVTDANGRFIVAVTQGEGTYLLKARPGAGTPYQATSFEPTVFMSRANAASGAGAVLRFSKTGG